MISNFKFPIPNLCLVMVNVFSALVPASRRSEWKSEWQAEIQYYWNRLDKREELNFLTKGALVLRCLGALWHAVWLRRQEWRFEMLIQNFTYGFRALRNRPGFTTIAVLVLALGIGGNTAIFSVVYSVLLRPLPFKNPERLAMVFSHNTRQAVFHSNISPDDYWDFRSQNTVFDQMAATSPPWSFSISGNGEAEQLFGAWVSANFFPLLGVEPLLGRTFSSNEDRAGGPAVVVLSHGLWQRRFGGDRDILGKTLTIGGQSSEIIGVMPAGFRFIEASELWVPLEQNAFQTRGRNVRYLFAVGRLKAGLGIAEAQAGMDSVARALEQQYPNSNTGFGVTVVDLHERITGSARSILIVLLGAVGFVLLIACANVANLMLVRAADRSLEVAVRTALGANRGRLITQFLTESVLLSVIGAVGGLALAKWGIDFLLSLGPNLPRLAEVRIDGSVLAFTLFLSLLAGIGFGSIPAFQMSRSDLSEGLKEGGRGGSDGKRRHRTRSILVVSEIALALVLLVACGLMVRSFVQLVNVDPGYRMEKIIIAGTLVPNAKYPDPQSRLNLYYQLEEKLKSIPGVISVGAVSRFPLSGVIGSSNVTSFFTIEGRPVPTGERPEVDYRIASTDYFEAMGIPLIRGRKFTREDSTQVAIINDAMAKRFWPTEDPIGRHVNFGANTAQSPWVEIVGVAGNVRHLGLDLEPRPEIYRPYPNNPHGSPQIAIHTAVDPESVLGPIRAEMRGVERDLPLTISTMENLVAMSVAERRFSMFLLLVFAGVAMILAMVGIYGVMSYSVASRTHEIGLRMALGAESGQVLRLVVGEGLFLTSLGVGIGIVGAAFLTRVMTTLLYGIRPTDPLTFGAVSLALVIVGLLACYIPARRATKVDPIVTLRYE